MLVTSIFSLSHNVPQLIKDSFHNFSQIFSFLLSANVLGFNKSKFLPCDNGLNHTFPFPTKFGSAKECKTSCRIEHATPASNVRNSNEPRSSFCRMKCMDNKRLFPHCVDLFPHCVDFKNFNFN